MISIALGAQLSLLAAQECEEVLGIVEAVAWRTYGADFISRI